LLVSPLCIQPCIVEFLPTLPHFALPTLSRYLRFSSLPSFSSHVKFSLHAIQSHISIFFCSLLGSHYSCSAGHNREPCCSTHCCANWSRASCNAALALARTQLEGGLADLAKERANELDEVNKGRAKGIAEVAKDKADLHREITAMQKQQEAQQEAQQGRVVLDIGGYRYTTSVQNLRRLPGTFFDAYFSGRYTMDRSEDGSIFIDRDGKHFGQVLEYLRDGVVSVSEQDASELDVSELRWLKREFGFYCIELSADPQEVAFAVGGANSDGILLASVERYDASSGVWREVAPMATARTYPGLCELSGGVIYAIGGKSMMSHFN
jgi:hypothetical protein